LLKRVGSTNMSPPAKQDQAKPELAFTPTARRAATLPEPYLGSEVEIVPTYVVGATQVAVTVPTASSPAAQSPPRPYYDLRSADELYFYWDGLRGQRALPFLADLDRTCIAISWPNTLILSFCGHRSRMPEISRLSRFDGAIKVTPLITEWIISSSRQVTQIGKAMETERAFPAQQNMRRYQMMLLPFASANEVGDNVLCHLSCRE
jgi:hypothetical protein